MAIDIWPTSNIILMHHAETKLLLESHKEPTRIQRSATEVEKSRSVIRNARTAELEPEQMQLIIGMPIGDAPPIAPVTLTGIKNHEEIPGRKPLEPDSEPKQHNE